MYQFQKYSSRACQTTHILKFFGLRQKFDESGFFFKIQNFMWEKIVAGVINGLSINKNFDEKKNFKIPKFSRQKWVECEIKKKFKTLSAHHFLKVELVPQFRKLLNVWHIQNLEQPFLIWASNCPVKFWRSPKNFKFQNFFGENSLLI